MNNDVLEQIGSDVELAKSMASISDSEELLSLEARLIGYLDLLQEKADEYEFKSTQLRGKHKTLKEFIRTVHSRRTELSISNSLTRKGI